MHKVIWRPQAIDDLRGIIGYINQFDAAAAQDIGARLYDLGESLAEFPQRGRPKTGGTRELVTVSPYILTYEVVDGAASILSVRHGRRRPLP